MNDIDNDLNNHEWKCYICLETYANEIIPEYSCRKCKEGTMCYSCFYDLNNNQNKCGICREEYPTYLYDTNIEQNSMTSDRYVILSLYFFLAFLIPFFICLVDILLIISTMTIHHINCPNLDYLFIFVSIFIKSVVSIVLMLFYGKYFRNTKGMYILRGIQYISLYVYIFLNFNMLKKCSLGLDLLTLYGFFELICIASNIVYSVIYKINT